MKTLRRLMAAFAVVGLLAGASCLYAACSGSDVMCFVVGGTQVFRVDSSGNETVAGTLAVTGASTLTGAITTGGAVTAGGVINTASGTPYAILFSSVTAVVPTGTPTATGILAVSTSNILYISTSTGVGGWQKIGAQ